jgi:hypothetical protein
LAYGYRTVTSGVGISIVGCQFIRSVKLADWHLFPPGSCSLSGFYFLVQPGSKFLLLYLPELLR